MTFFFFFLVPLFCAVLHNTPTLLPVPKQVVAEAYAVSCVLFLTCIKGRKCNTFLIPIYFHCTGPWRNPLRWLSFGGRTCKCINNLTLICIYLCTYSFCVQYELQESTPTERPTEESAQRSDTEVDSVVLLLFTFVAWGMFWPFFSFTNRHRVTSVPAIAKKFCFTTWGLKWLGNNTKTPKNCLSAK